MLLFPPIKGLGSIAPLPQHIAKERWDGKSYRGLVPCTLSMLLEIFLIFPAAQRFSRLAGKLHFPFSKALGQTAALPSA